jgi:hypothetical protein
MEIPDSVQTLVAEGSEAVLLLRSIHLPAFQNLSTLSLCSCE